MIDYNKTTDKPQEHKPRVAAVLETTTSRTNGTSLPSAKMVMVVKHPVAQHALTVLRNKHTPPHQFRTSSNQLLVALLMEAIRTVPTRAENVATAGDEAVGQVMMKPVVLLAIERQGVGLAHRMVEIFPDMLVGTIGFDNSSNGQRGNVRLHLSNAPALGDARVIVFDPVVATGASARRAIGLVRRGGATDIALVSFVVSTPGLDHLQTDMPELHVWTAAIESKLDSRRGPLPGVGDFAARLFG